MQYNQLGQSDLQVSAIGFGCMSLGNEERAASDLIHRALELGVNYFDTADLYDKGLNERMLGNILHEKRDMVILATKVGNQWRKDGSGWDWNPRKEYITGAVEESLTRLRTDRIDLYQLHGGTMDDPIDETIEAFELLRQQGKIRYYGISSIRPAVIREYSRRSGTVSVMMQYSLLDRRPEESCLAELKSRGIGVLARGAVAKGLLAGKPAGAYTGPGEGAAAYLKYSVAEVERAALAVAAVSGQTRSEAQTAIQFVLDNSAISSAVVGLRTIGQLEDAVRALEAPWLTSEDRQVLQGAIPANSYE
jgi:aryl-alcohol dehydrogenase-like predicted oxidoreductase